MYMHMYIFTSLNNYKKPRSLIVALFPFAKEETEAQRGYVTFPVIQLASGRSGI